MKLASAIAIALGTLGCRQILGIDPGSLRGDAAIDAADAMLEDTPAIVPDMATDAGAMWSVIEVVPGSIAGDQDPTLTNDMLQLFFTRGPDIYSMTRSAVDEDWGAPAIVGGLSEGDSVDTNPEITGEGLVILFASDRGAGAGLDIYASTRNIASAGWAPPVAFPALNAQSLTIDDFPGSGTADGERVVLSSNRDNNQLDIYESTRVGATGTTYGAPVKSTVSTGREESAAFLTADGLTMYFAGFPNVLGPRDLYVATRATRADPWGPRQEISELNTVFNDTDPWVSPDGRHIYFASSRSGSLLLYHASR